MSARVSAGDLNCNFERHKLPHDEKTYRDLRVQTQPPLLGLVRNVEQRESERRGVDPNEDAEPRAGVGRRGRLARSVPV